MVRRKLTTEEFIKRAMDIHGNLYDYTKTEYVNYDTKLIITCPKHGDFKQSPTHHLNGEGCPKCRYIKSASSKRRSLDKIINLANKTHNNKYDYSLIKEYKNDKEKLPIICKLHGIFYQTMNNHINGKQECPICVSLRNNNDKIYTTEEFIELAQLKHNNFYSYDNTKYEKSDKNVTITCKIHGDFEQIARNHLQGQGCPKCFKDKSNIEKEITDFIKTIINDEIIENDRNILNGKEIDILIPNKKIGIEINGLIWHSEKYEHDNLYHLNKTLLANEKGIRLIHIYEDEWIYKNNIVKSRLKSILNVIDSRIYARKCEIKEVSFKESNEFLEENHLQGKSLSKYRYGLYYNNELVSLMTFCKLRKVLGSNNKDDTYELLRFCNKLDTTVIGGASKLLSYFIKIHKPIEIISYADRRWSDGNLYFNLGFELTHTSKPNYSYVINKKRVHRFNLRKDILVNKYNCPNDKTEHQFCLEQKWYRIYDCGCLCFRKHMN